MVFTPKQAPSHRRPADFTLRVGYPGISYADFLRARRAARPVAPRASIARLVGSGTDAYVKLSSVMEFPAPLALPVSVKMPVVGVPPLMEFTPATVTSAVNTCCEPLRPEGAPLWLPAKMAVLPNMVAPATTWTPFAPLVNMFTKFPKVYEPNPKTPCADCNGNPATLISKSGSDSESPVAVMLPLRPSVTCACAEPATVAEAAAAAIQIQRSLVFVRGLIGAGEIGVFMG